MPISGVARMSVSHIRERASRSAHAGCDRAVRTTCPYCGVGCGLVVRANAVGGIAVAGDAEHPANFGRICSKGAALGETVGLHGRLLHPMLRQADGTLARSTWSDALDHV